MEQITLWNLINNNERDINKLSIEETVDIINRECGLNLKFDNYLKDYRQKMKHGWVIAVEYSNYYADYDEDMKGEATGDRFVDLSIMSNKGGLGKPCDSIEECIETINRWIERQGMK